MPAAILSVPMPQANNPRSHSRSTRVAADPASVGLSAETDITCDRLTFRFSEKLREPEWDSLLGSIPGAHFEQSSGWGAVRAKYGWEVFRILAFVEGKMVGGVQVLSRRFGRWGKVGFVARGPVVAPGSNELGKLLADRVCGLARKESWLYCVFDYPYESHALAASMASTGFFPHPSAIPPAGLLTATTLVDLDLDEGEILARIKRNHRHDIRLAQRSGLSFAEGGPADLPRFRELMVATCKRRVGHQYSTPQPSQEDYFINLWAELGDRGWVRLFLVRYDDEIISAVIAFTLSNTIRLWRYGWSGAHSNKHPNHLLYWEVIRWAKTHGFSKLDFVWVDTEDAKRAARGELSPLGFRDGTTHFKLGFGGELYFPPTAQSCFFHPLARLAYRCGGVHLLGNDSFQRFVLRLWSRATGR